MWLKPNQMECQKKKNYIIYIEESLSFSPNKHFVVILKYLLSSKKHSMVELKIITRLMFTISLEKI